MLTDWSNLLVLNKKVIKIKKITLALTTSLLLALTACSESTTEVKQESTQQETANYSSSFTEKEFKSLQASNSPILIDIHATWCSTCKKQSQVLEYYSKDNPELKILRVDFDEQKVWVKFFKGTKSTFVIFKGNNNMGTLVAETDKDKIGKFLSKVK
jgi:thioredoxin 1